VSKSPARCEIELRPPLANRVCLSETRLPSRTMTMAAALAGNKLGSAFGIWCVIEQHKNDTAHVGCVIDVSYRDAVWASWRDGEVPTKAMVLPFCPAKKSRLGCSSYTNHPGGHTWELRNSPDR